MVTPAVSIWYPSSMICTFLHPYLIENVQKLAARFMTRNYSRETGSMTDIFEELKWEILQLRKGGRIIGSYYCKKVCEVKSKIMQMTLSQNRRLQKSTLNGLSD